MGRACGRGGKRCTVCRPLKLGPRNPSLLILVSLFCLYWQSFIRKRFKHRHGEVRRYSLHFTEGKVEVQGARGHTARLKDLVESVGT